MNYALYNEIDPFAADWLERLVAAKHIGPGIVERRSIADLTADDVAGPGQRHFFAGIGGWSYALRRAGIDDDSNVWTGSCPCQPFSGAGKRRGLRDPRHLWPAWFALIEKCRPAVIFGEQVASRDSLAWLDLVYADLERCGYAVGSADLCAASVGAPHIRQRLYFVAYADSVEGRLHLRPRQARQTDTEARGRSEAGDHTSVAASAVGGFWADADWIPCTDGVSRPIEPGTFPLAHGVPARVGRLRGYGNAINVEQAVAFIEAAIAAKDSVT